MKRTYGIVSKLILYPLITALNCTPSYGIVMCTGASTHSHLILLQPNIFILIEKGKRVSLWQYQLSKLLWLLDNVSFSSLITGPTSHKETGLSSCEVTSLLPISWENSILPKQVITRWENHLIKSTLAIKIKIHVRIASQTPEWSMGNSNGA